MSPGMVPKRRGVASLDRALRPCPVPGCPELTDQPKGCEYHRATSGHAQAYDSAWATFAAGYLRRHPLCENCRQRPSAEVHHKIAVRVGPAKRLDPLNAVALCHTCHRAATPTVRADAGRTTRRTR